MKNNTKEDIKRRLMLFDDNTEKFVVNFAKWTGLSTVIGLVVGVIGSLFSMSMTFVTTFRNNNPYIVLGLPLAGLAIVFLYSITKRENDKGTNSIIAAVRNEEELSLVMAPLIFVSTVLTHLFGGSAGREGAALQIGGSIGSGFAKLFKVNENDKHVMIMCGMSACFSALFGTPIAAAVFPMEVVSVGIMYYSALVPCVFSSLIAYKVAECFGIGSEAMKIACISQFNLANGVRCVMLGILCALLSIAFCTILHYAARKGQKLIPNHYIRIFVAGVLVILLSFLFNTTDYMGAGMNIIEDCMEGVVKPEAFILKIIFTAITLGSGYKGGEIVPSFFVGATFGAVIGSLIGLSPSLCAAVGMIALFCGVTNSPITSMLIAFELFGMEAFPFILIGVAVSYMLSGYSSLYHTQKIVYSKTNAEYLGK